MKKYCYEDGESDWQTGSLEVVDQENKWQADNWTAQQNDCVVNNSLPLIARFLQMIPWYYFNLLGPSSQPVNDSLG